MRIATGRPTYVVGTEAETNRVIVGDREALLSSSLTADGANFLTPEAAGAFDGDGGIKCHAKVRYNADPEPATLYRTGDDTFRVEFDEPQSAIAPGQAVVCYAGDLVLAGGWIRATVREGLTS